MKFIFLGNYSNVGLEGFMKNPNQEQHVSHPTFFIDFKSPPYSTFLANSNRSTKDLYRFAIDPRKIF